MNCAEELNMVYNKMMEEWEKENLPTTLCELLVRRGLLTNVKGVYLRNRRREAE